MSINSRGIRFFFDQHLDPVYFYQSFEVVGSHIAQIVSGNEQIEFGSFHFYCVAVFCWLLFYLIYQGEPNNLQNVKIELTSENDLFFHYTHIVNEDSFRMMQENQKLMIEFTDYTNILIKMVNSCIKEPHSFLAVFIMNRDGTAKLDFIQNIEYKFIELLSCDFMASPEDTVR